MQQIAVTVAARVDIGERVIILAGLIERSERLAERTERLVRADLERRRRVPVDVVGHVDEARPPGID